MLGGTLRGGLGVIVPHLLEVGISVLEPRAREDPVQIGMRELGDVSAGSTLTTTGTRATVIGAGIGAEQALG